MDAQSQPGSRQDASPSPEGRGRPRRIALFTGNYVNVVDGVSLTLNRLAAAVLDRGDDITVFAPDAFRRSLEPTGRLVWMPSIPFYAQPEYRLAAGFGFRRALARYQPDLIHIATPDRLGYNALRWAKRHGVTTVASFHSNLVSYLDYMGPLHPGEKWAWAYFKNFYGSCAHTYVPTESMAAELRAHGIDADMRIWDRGVDPERFNPGRRSAAFRQRHGIGEDEVVVVFVARLRWEKGLKVLAEVIQGLEQRGVPHRSVIVGKGIGEASLREWLPNTVFTGHLEGNELAEAYASSDIFLYPSETDTFGNVTLEAMASGLATICADAPGAKNLVVDGVTGALAVPRSVESFLEHTERVLTDAELRRGMAQAALERSRRYTWDAAMGRLMGYYDELLGPR